MNTKNFINYAHRGASEYAPENTFLSFYLGMFMEANGIETDVQLTKDGVAVLFHDSTLDRVTDQTGNLADYTYAELCEFWVEKNGIKDKIVTLEDFIAHFGCRDITFAIELKGKGSARPTAEIIKKYGIKDKVVATSFSYQELLDFKSVLPDCRTGFLALEAIDEKLLNNMKADGIGELCPEAKVITKEKCDYWHSLGFNVRAWGVTNEQLMKDAYYAGVNGMTVNFPDKLTNLLKDNK